MYNFIYLSQSQERLRKAGSVGKPCLVPRGPCILDHEGPSHQQNALTEKAWENAVQGLSKENYAF